MAIEVLDYRLQEGFNQIFTKLVNNEIVNAPYNIDYKSQFFFLKKRKGIQPLFQVTGIRFVDYTVYENSIEFLLGKDGAGNYVVYKNDGSGWVEDLTITGGGQPDKFVKVLGGGGAIIDSGTATGGTATTLEDTSKTWVDNELAGYYIYIKDGMGAGQIREILSNTANTIEVSGWDTIPDNTSQYVIYQTKTYNILIPYNNGVYVYDGIAWYDAPVFSGMNIKDMTLWNTRLWWATGNYILYSEIGDYFFSPAGNELMVSDININNLYGFGDYLFVTTENTIGLVYKGFSTTDGTEFFVLKEGLSQIGVKNKGAIGIYKGNVYFVASDGRLYTITTNVVGQEVLLNLNDNGDLPASFIKQNFDFDIKVYSDVNFLYLFADIGGTTNEIYYDSFYKGWLNNEYKTSIYKKLLYKGNEYVLGYGFFGSRGGLKDIDQDYGQVIKAVVGEIDIWQWKFIRFVNILLGKSDYIQGGVLRVYNNIGNKKYMSEWQLDNIGYLTEIMNSLPGPIGANILGNITLGGESTLQEYVSDIEVIQVLMNKAGHIIEIEFDTGTNENGLFFGGIQIYYDKVHPKIKSFSNII